MTKLNKKNTQAQNFGQHFRKYSESGVSKSIAVKMLKLWL